MVNKKNYNINYATVASYNWLYVIRVLQIKELKS